MKTTNTITSTQYLNKEATHREYYSQFVTKDIKERVLREFNPKILIKGKDQHFNNIPLRLWDNLMTDVPFEINNKLKECGDYPTQAGIVCILKEAAMQIVEKN